MTTDGIVNVKADHKNFEDELVNTIRENICPFRTKALTVTF